MRMQLQAYDMQIVYKKGKHMHIADALSRNYLEETAITTEIEDDIASVN